MAPSRRSRLIVRRDGRDAMVFLDEPSRWYQTGTLTVLSTVGYRESQEVGVALFSVMVMGATLSQLGSGLLLLSATVDEELEVLAECALGDHMDAQDEPLPDEGTLPITVSCAPDYPRQLADRTRCSDDAALLYLAAKTWWADKLHRPPAVFYQADALRLGYPVKGLLWLARAHDGEHWTFVGDARADGFMLRPTPALMQSGPRMRGRVVTGPVFDVLDRLGSARYQASAAQLVKAYAFLGAAKPDYENAAKEAVGALESLARRLSGESTLGKSATKLQAQQIIDTPTAKILTDLYEYRNRTPGVGHGGTVPPASEVFEARLIVNLCASALLFLVELDT